MAVPALYLFGTDAPVEICVRVHEKLNLTGGISGLATAHMRDESLHIRFWRDDIALPRRGAIISISEGMAYRVGETLQPYGATIDATVTRLSAAEAAGLPVLPA